MTSKGRGWHGEPERHSQVAKKRIKLTSMDKQRRGMLLQEYKKYKRVYDDMKGREGEWARNHTERAKKMMDRIKTELEKLG